MAMIFDSEEEGDIEQILEDTDYDDDDYVPDGGGNSDSDPEHGKRKRKSSPLPSTPNKRTRSSSKSSLPKSFTQSRDKKTASQSSSFRRESNVSKGGISLAATKVRKCSTSKSSKRKTPKRIEKKDGDSDGADKMTDSSLRRSSRSTRTHGVSYADADISEEEYYEEEELFHSDDNVENVTQKAQGDAQRKKHVEELWSSFKDDVKKDAKIEDRLKQSEQMETIKLDPTESKKEKQAGSSSQINNKGISNTDKVGGSVTMKLKIGQGESKEEPSALFKEQKEEKSSESTESSDSQGNKLEVSSEESNGKYQKGSHAKMVKSKLKLSSTSSATKNAVTVGNEAGKYEHCNTSTNEFDMFPGNSSWTKIDSKNNIVSEDKNRKKEKLQSSPSNSEGKVAVTQTFNFADEEVKISKELDADSKEAKQSQQNSASVRKTAPVQTKPGTSSGISNLLSLGTRKTGGLSGVLGNIDKKKKISVLDKTKYDWDNYKSEAGLEDELKSNRNAGYLDRQEFLQRVDYKQWESEREMRLYSNRK